jgi:hypothetical protein
VEPHSRARVASPLNEPPAQRPVEDMSWLAAYNENDWVDLDEAQPAEPLVPIITSTDGLVPLPHSLSLSLSDSPLLLFCFSR